MLSQRIVPAGLTWIWSGNAAGSDSASNWQNWVQAPGQQSVPGAGDLVNFDGSQGVNSLKDCDWDLASTPLASLSLGQNYGGTVFVKTDLQTDTLRVEGSNPAGLPAIRPSVSVDNAVTLRAGTTNLAEAQLKGDGAFSLDLGAAPTFNGGDAVQINTKNVTFAAGAVADLNGGLQVGANVLFTQGGVLNLLGGNLDLGVGTVMTNAQEIWIDGARSITGTGLLVNYGVVTKGGGVAGVPNLANITSPFFNFATTAGQGIYVGTGTLTLNNNSDFDAGQSEVVGGASLAWEGEMTLGGTVHVTGAGALSIREQVTVQGGMLNSDIATVVMDNAKSMLTGTGMASFTGANFLWQNGTFKGLGANLTIGGTLTISAPNNNDPHTLDGTQVSLTGTTVWSGGSILMANGAEIRNLGLFQANSGGSIMDLGGTANNSFKNVKDVMGMGTGSLSLLANTTIDVGMINDGNVDVNGKTLKLEKGTITQGVFGVITLANGTIEATNMALTFTLNGGLMEGYGKIDGGFVFTSGIVRFDPATTLTVTGNFTQARDAVLDYHFVNGWGLLAVGGTAKLDGKFQFSEDVGTPNAGQWYDFLTAVGGTSAGVDGPLVVNSPGYVIDLQPNKLRGHN